VCTDQWEVEALAAKLEISDDLLLKHTSVWINHGLLTFSPDRKVLIAVTSFQDARYDNDALMEEMETAVSSDAQEAEDLQMLETYIVGMLSNFGSLPIQRIHNMLSTFARSGAQPCTYTVCFPLLCAIAVPFHSLFKTLLSYYCCTLQMIKPFLDSP
jgi:anaphase-promoting complex subunit 2